MKVLDRKKSLSVAQQRKRQRMKTEFAAWGLILPAVIALYIVVWRPTVFGFIWSLFKMKGYSTTEFIGFQNYIEVIKDTQFVPILWNTVQYVIWSFVIGFIPPLIIAAMISEMVHFSKAFRFIIYLPAVLPGVTVMLMWYYIYYPDSSGLLNMLLTKFGMAPYVWLEDPKFTILYIVIAMTWRGFPATMLLYFASIKSISVELYEAATIDGAGIWARFRNITLPQISGVLLLNMIRQIISVFQVLQEPMTMTSGGPNGASTSVGYQLYRYGFVSGRVGHALALGVIIFLMLMIFTCFYFYLNKKVEENY